MNPEIKKEWVEALRTGELRGLPIKQVYGELRSADDLDGTARMCCLGVLTEMARQDGVDIRCVPTEHGYDWQEKVENGDEGATWESLMVEDLSHAVQQWAGTTSSNPYVIVDDPEKAKKYSDTIMEGPTNRFTLATLNDFTDQGFAGIADLIEEQL